MILMCQSRVQVANLGFRGRFENDEKGRCYNDLVVAKMQHKFYVKRYFCKDRESGKVNPNTLQLAKMGIPLRPENEN